MSVEQKRRALITGASSGIGRETALAFARAGMDLALVSRSMEKLATVCQAAKHAGVEAKAYPLDLSCVSLVQEKCRK